MNAKILAPTLATWSPSQGWSGQAPGLPRQCARSSSGVIAEGSPVARVAVAALELLARAAGARGVARHVAVGVVGTGDDCCRDRLGGRVAVDRRRGVLQLRRPARGVETLGDDLGVVLARARLGGLLVLHLH